MQHNAIRPRRTVIPVLDRWLRHVGDVDACDLERVLENGEHELRQDYDGRVFLLPTRVDE